jgi:hypothetical protein
VPSETLQLAERVRLLPRAVGPVATAGLLLTPAPATLYLAFSSGGYHAGAVALAALVALLLLTVRCALAAESLHGLALPALVPAGALAT